MSKRYHNESNEERWRRKKMKYEYKLQKNRNRHLCWESHEEHEDHQGNLDQNTEVEVEATESTLATVQIEASDILVQVENCTEDTNVFDPTLLKALGESDADIVEFGDDIQTDLASRLQKILLTGLPKEVKDEILKKYQFPKNLPLAKGPTLNLKIGAMLAEVWKDSDKRLLVKQDQLGKALSSLGIAMTGLMKKNANIPEVIRTLIDTARLLADSHYTETETRCSVIIPLIDKTLMKPFKGRNRDSYLFSENLGDPVRNTRGIIKTSELIQASTSSNLNPRVPSSRRVRYKERGAGGRLLRARRPKTTHQHRGLQQQPPPTRRFTPPPARYTPPRLHAHRHTAAHSHR